MAPIQKALVLQLLADPAQAHCPICGSVGFYDNRESPKRGKGPYFKCKNKECDDGKGFSFGVFQKDVEKFAPTEEQHSPGTPNTGPTGTGPRARPTSKQIAAAYHESVKLALFEGQIIGKQGMPVTAENIASMAATIFIARGNAGVWAQVDEPAKPPEAKPVPKPATKAPPQEEEQEQGEQDGEDDSLPF